jgi:hypothetical protein
VQGWWATASVPGAGPDMGRVILILLALLLVAALLQRWSILGSGNYSTAPEGQVRPMEPFVDPLLVRFVLDS